jgi:hypothetical protein
MDLLSYTLIIFSLLFLLVFVFVEWKNRLKLENKTEEDFEIVLRKLELLEKETSDLFEELKNKGE